MTDTPKDPNQRALDLAVEHIKKQRQPSILDNGIGACAYRGRGGLQCAFAPMIADYSADIEGCSASELIEEQPDVLHPWARTIDREFANSLQHCHDANSRHRGDAFVYAFMVSARNLASRYDLTIED